MKILVTGANGFVGQAVCDKLVTAQHQVVKGVRNAQNYTELAIGNIDAKTEWSNALKGCDAVVHLAARVHVMRETATNALAEFRKVNTIGTLNLAHQAATTGVKRFLYMSSIKVNGEAGTFSDAKQYNPQDAYAQSKWEAEVGLRLIAAQTGMEVVILRPPLVYGPHVGANFYRLLKAVDRNTPLPFGMVKNRRSMVYVDNLADAVATSLTHARAAGQTYLVSDGNDTSTPGLIKLMAQALGKSPRLISVPPTWLRLGAKLSGRSEMMERLIGSLAVDSTTIQQELGWYPPYSIQESMRITANWYLATKS